VSEPALDLEALRSALAGRLFGNPLVAAARLDSTNDRALALLEDGSPEGTLVLAEEQTRGKGRRGRSWVSPPRLGLYASLILRPPADSPMLLPLLTFAAALGIARSLEEKGCGDVRIKWPNDVLVAGKKVAGLLAEARGGSPGGAAVVIGLGLNVNQGANDFPEEIRGRATSLRIATGRWWDRTRLIPDLLALWEEEHRILLEAGASLTLARWRPYSAFPLGARLRVEQDGNTRLGRYQGLAPSGELRLEMDDGTIQAVAFGEAARVREE